MKYYLFCFLFFNLSSCLFAQKPIIDSTSYRQWPAIRDPAISDDGNYAMYTIDNEPIGDHTLVICSTKTAWNLKITGLSTNDAGFADSGSMAIFKNTGDSLFILSMAKQTYVYINDINNYAYAGRGGSQWLAFSTKKRTDELHVRNLSTNVELSFSHILHYEFDESGKVLLLEVDSSSTDDKGSDIQLFWLSLANGKLKLIYKGAQAENFRFNADNRILAFSTTEERDGKIQKLFWCYNQPDDKLTMLTDDHPNTIGADYKINYILNVNEDGSSIFVRLERIKSEKQSDTDPHLSKVVIWSYTDPELKSQELKEKSDPRYFNLVAAIKTGKNHLAFPVLLDGDFSPQANFLSSNHLIVHHQEVNCGYGENEWNPAYRPQAYLESVVTGERQRIKYFDGRNGTLSPSGKYIVYYDKKSRNYYSYETASGLLKNITAGIPATWTGGYNGDDHILSPTPRGIAAWMKNDSAVLLYDQNDLWLVSLIAKEMPVNLTNGYGAKHDIVFFLAYENEGHKIFSMKDKLLLTAFDKKSKNNGFFTKVLNTKGNPGLLTMGPYVYYIPHHPGNVNGVPVVKAADTEAYLVRREGFGEFPNYYFTSDFKSFKALSALSPEKEYNWMSAELMTWKTIDGQSCQGILYKPDNFDPQKKYPVIFTTYEIQSDGLNGFLSPAPSNGVMNIPTFVSNGYLVFAADIHFTVGQPGESTVNAIVPAVRLLAGMPWVDSSKIGITGCSFGGYETNYLITHTHMFAAACSVSGASDFVSYYDGLTGWGTSQQNQFESGEYRIGGSLWDRPDLYIKNSPLFYANAVSTPLLMMATPADGAVPFSQAVELFTALRRLGKTVWMLEYDDGNHVVSGKSADDFGIRLAQFFGHYLKGLPSPDWMTGN